MEQEDYKKLLDEFLKIMEVFTETGFIQRLELLEEKVSKALKDVREDPPQYLGNSTVELISYPNFDEVFNYSTRHEVSFMLACQEAAGNKRDIEVFIKDFYANKEKGGFDWGLYSLLPSSLDSEKLYTQLSEIFFPRDDLPL